MKFLLLTVLCVALAQGERDWSKVIPEPVLRGTYPKLQSNASLRITGGEETEPNEYPWQVALFIPLEGGTAFCGGSLISQRTVLTAARCLDEIIIGEIEVVLGAHRVREQESTQVRYNTGEYLIFPNYDPVTLHDDVALVYLPEPVELSDAIQVVPLPRDGNHHLEETATATGWGKESDASLTISPVLRKVDMRIISNTVCNILYLGQIVDTQMCTAGDEGRSTCDGDSGGPLVYKGVQLGIVSFSVNHGCEAGWPPAFTRVSSYVVWINFNLR